MPWGEKLDTWQKRIAEAIRELDKEYYDTNKLRRATRPYSDAPEGLVMDKLDNLAAVHVVGRGKVGGAARNRAKRRLGDQARVIEARVRRGSKESKHPGEGG
jgi:hypothetical protein